VDGGMSIVHVGLVHYPEGDGTAGPTLRQAVRDLPLSCELELRASEPFCKRLTCVAPPSTLPGRAMRWWAGQLCASRNGEIFASAAFRRAQDDNLYSRREFSSFFGRLDEWHAAESSETVIQPEASTLAVVPYALDDAPATAAPSSQDAPSVMQAALTTFFRLCLNLDELSLEQLPAPGLRNLRRVGLAAQEVLESLQELHGAGTVAESPLLDDRAVRKMLIFACSPTRSPLANVIYEALDVAQRLDVSARDICNGGTAEDLRRMLLTPTRMFLFSGHADAPSPSGGGFTLGFTQQGGGLAQVRPEDIASVLGASARPPAGKLELVVLNGCRSLELGRAARAAGVPTVICWQTQAEDGAARYFILEFFVAMETGCDCRTAFQSAVQALRQRVHPEPWPNPMYQVCEPSAATQQQSVFTCQAPECPCCPRRVRPDGSRAHMRLPFASGVPVLVDAQGEHRADQVV